MKTGDLFSVLFKKALSGDADGGGLLTYNYYSGEPITQTAEGRPLMVRLPEARLSLGNFMRTQIYSAFATLKIGMDLLMEEDVPIRTLYGHGGLFKTPGVAQRFLAAALQTPVTLLSFAGEGGAWGIALLAAFAGEKGEEESLEQFLQNRVFHEVPRETCDPLEEDVLGFSQFMERYRNGITIEKEAIDKIKD